MNRKWLLLSGAFVVMLSTEAFETTARIFPADSRHTIEVWPENDEEKAAIPQLTVGYIREDGRGQTDESRYNNQTLEPIAFHTSPSGSLLIDLELHGEYEHLLRFSAPDTNGKVKQLDEIRLLSLRPICSALSLGQGLYYFTWDQLSSHEGMSFPAMLLCMVLLGLVGYFAAAMLLKKSFKVLRTGWRGAAVLTAALLVLGVCVDLDVLGVEDRIPAPASVESVTVSLGGRMGGYGELADPAAIEQIVTLHGAILQERNQDQAGSYGWLDLRYHLKNGGLVVRSYAMGDNSTGTSRSAALYRDLATSPAFQRANMLEDLEGRRLAGGELRNPNGYASLDAGEAQIVYDALVADIDAGHFGTTALMGERAWAEITYVNELSLIFMSEDRPNSSFSRGFTFTSNCTNLIAALEEVGAVDGENPLQTYMELYPEDYADVQPAFSDQELADQAVLTRAVG